MSASKMITATVLCSLSGTAFWFGIRGVQQDTGDRAGDQTPEQEAEQSATRQAQPKAAIATPERLAKSKSAAKPTAKPMAQIPQSSSGELSDRPTNYEARIQQLQATTLPAYRVSTPESLAATGRDRDDEPIPRQLMHGSLQDIQGHWAQYYIEYLATRRIIQGFPDGSFRPEAVVTSAEFTTMASKALQTAKAQAVFAQLRSRLTTQALTRAEAAALIYQALVSAEPAPIVTSIQVDGAVARPGGYSLAALSSLPTPGEERLPPGGDLPTVSRAIQQAGGSLANADLQQVEIHRTTDTGTTKIIKVAAGDNAGRSPQAETLTPDAVLQQNDRLVVREHAPLSQTLEPLEPQPPKPPPALEPAELEAPITQQPPP